MLLTIDIGTSNFKAAIWEFSGKCLGYAAVPLPECRSFENNHEISPSVWLSAFESCVCFLAKNNNCNLSAVDAIVISGNGPTLVPVLGKALFDNGKLYVDTKDARLWLDRKRYEKYQVDVFNAVGYSVDAAFFLPKILGIKNDEIELYHKVKYFLGCPEFLAYALTGSAKTVIPGDGFDRWFWDDSVLQTLNLNPKKFPSFIRPGDIFGNLLLQIGRYFGFKKNIPVISGGPDFFAAILGAGVTKPGQVCCRTGSSDGINLCTKKFVEDNRLMSYGHPILPYYNLSGVINTTGLAAKWGYKFLGLEGFELPPYNLFSEIAKKSKPGSGGVIFNPNLAGGRGHSSGGGSWSGINLNSNRNDFANSIFEGIGFATRKIIKTMEENKVKVSELRVTGGFADDEYLNQIKADITGRVIHIPKYKEAELLGLAIIGSVSLGKYKSYSRCSSAFVRIEKSYEPNPEYKNMYDELYINYCSFTDVRKLIFNNMYVS